MSDLRFKMFGRSTLSGQIGGRSTLTGAVGAHFPASVNALSPIDITQSNGNYTFSIDIDELAGMLPPSSDTFLELTDTPDSYGGQAGKIVAVNAGANALEFIPASASGGAPATAQYLTLALDGTLANERVLTAGTNVSFVDTGPNGTLTINASGGSGTPGGINTQVQFNDGGVFGGDAGLAYDKATDTLTGVNANLTGTADTNNAGAAAAVNLSGGIKVAKSIFLEGVTGGGFWLGSGSGNRIITINGGASAPGDGAAYQHDLGGLLALAWGNKSAIFSGAYDNTTCFVSTHGLKMLNGAGGGATPLFSPPGLLQIASDGTVSSVASTAVAREILTADRTYFVNSSTGSDSNNGLAAVVGGGNGPFATIQKAVDVAVALDLSIFQVFIQLANTTFTTAFPNDTVLKDYIGKGPITIQGSTSGVPAAGNFRINGGNAGFAAPGLSRDWVIRGVEISAQYGIRADAGSLVRIRDVAFGACSSSMLYAADGSAITNEQRTGFAGDAMALRGNSPTPVDCLNRSEITLSFQAITVTGALTGTQFLRAFNVSLIIAQFNSFSGGGTFSGLQYNVQRNSVIDAAGSALPGTGNTTLTGGIFAT
jgi:hypothetical protein